MHFRRVLNDGERERERQRSTRRQRRRRTKSRRKIFCRLATPVTKNERAREREREITCTRQSRGDTLRDTTRERPKKGDDAPKDTLLLLLLPTTRLIKTKSCCLGIPTECTNTQRDTSLVCHVSSLSPQKNTYLSRGEETTVFSDTTSTKTLNTPHQ